MSGDHHGHGHAGTTTAICHLPHELLCYILNELLPEGLAGLVAQVCRRWRECVPPDKRNLMAARTILALTSTINEGDEQENAPLWKWATDRGLLITSKKLFVIAAATGRLDVLHALAPSHQPWYQLEPPRYKAATKEAAKGGHLHVLQWLFQRAQSWQRKGFVKDTCHAAAIAGHTHILKWVAHTPLLHGPGDALSGQIVEAAALGGQLETLKWMKDEMDKAAAKEETGREQLEYYAECVFRAAAAGGHLHLLRWVASSELGCAPKGDPHIYYWAASGGRLDVLQWLHDDLGIHYDGSKYACYQAATAGHLDALRWLLARGGKLDETLSAFAAKAGHLPVLQWLFEQGCPWNDSAVGDVAGRGHTDVLRWLYQRQGGEALTKADSSTSLCTRAASNGHLETLKFLRLEVQPQFAWGVETSRAVVACPRVANKKALALLRWMREEADPPCPWDEKTSQEAVQKERWKLLRWMCWEAQPPCPASQRTLRRLRVHEKEKGAARKV
ncbi:Ankyrin repeat domain containing protein [Balamuthia mandrillaris]